MVAFGMVNMGLSRDDLLSMTPGEFAEAQNLWHERAEKDYFEKWHFIRTLAAIVIQPHLRRKVTPQQLIPLPGDKQRRKGRKPKENDGERSTPERFMQLISSES